MVREPPHDGCGDHDDSWREVPDDTWGESGTGTETDADPGPARLPRRATGSPPDRLSSVSGLMASVSTAYTAAHGHPLAHDGLVSQQTRRRRWSVGLRAGVVTALALALVTGTVVVRDLARTSGAPVPLAAVDSTADVPPEGGAAPGEKALSADDGALDGGAGDDGVADDGLGDLDAEVPGPARPARVAVHVVGQVTTPGVVEVAQGARVIDAITAAGGLTTSADAGAVNLARAVVDGEQIYVPAPGEPIPPSAAQQLTGSAPGAPLGDGTGTGASGESAAINLNTADAVALDGLPGIGPALAQRIIEWRETHGGFAVAEDLLEVSGIGPAVFAKIRDKVAV